MLPIISTGQYNHLTNGNFEQYNGACNNSTPINACTGWKDHNQYIPGNSYYYHLCRNSQTNQFGYQYPVSGSAYTGITTHNYYWNNYAIKTALHSEIIPLQPHVNYEVSLSVSLADTSFYATDGIGVFFYDNGPDTVHANNLTSINPQVLYSGYGIISDTQNWTRLIDTFTADSAYKNIVIGCFLNYTNMNIDTLRSGPTALGQRYAYYYLDSVVVKALDSFSVIFNDTLLCAGDTIEIKYITPDQYGVNNVFTAQLSNASGSFASPVNIGSKTTQWGGFMTCVIPPNTPNGSGYRIRVVSGSGVDTSRDNIVNIRIGNVATSGSSAGTNSPVCAGSTLTLSAASGVSGTTFLWTGPNSFSSTNANNSFTNAAANLAGTYYLTMQIHGCTRRDTFQVQVKPTPANVVASANTPLCAGDTLKLNASSSTSGLSWTWAGPGSYSVSTQNPVRLNTTTAMSGDYIVTADLNGCTAKDTVTVTVQPQPNAVTLSTSSPGCSGDTLYLNSTTSSTGASYNWVGPNSFSANTQNSYIANSTTAATGWYRMTAGLNGCSYKDSIYATINQTPTLPNISYNSPLCVGETLNLSTNATGNYYWKGAGNFTSNQQNPARTNMQFGDTGSYSLVVTVSGCSSDTAYTNIAINPLPFVAIAASPGATICNGQQVQFTAYPNLHGGTPAYQWYVNGIAAGNTTTVFNTSTLNNGDIVRCDMTETTKCSSPMTDASNDITITVQPILSPTVTINADNMPPWNGGLTVTFTATPTHGGSNPTYQWKRNGQDVVGATGPTWGVIVNALNPNEDICVVLKSSYECAVPDTAMSNCITTAFTGIGDIVNNKNIKIYPNPVKGVLHTEGVETGSTIELIDVLGRKCATHQLVGGTVALVDVSTLVPGVYVVKVNGVVVGRVVKE
ncbi:MAG: T9SS type A sorting domain-containing protein [Taibaiella sp.]|nr:T9SS type A sorting domain-containing protein [Taibaiella sp.]